MSFFKKLFSSKKRIDEADPSFAGIYSEEYFNKRYTEENIDQEDGILDGCLKMIESYFKDNKIDQKIATPINHPENLDQAVDDGMGFFMYCKAFDLQEVQMAMFLAYAFSDFLIKVYGFKLYKDNEPEYPLRSMTLKYDKKQIVMSLYPFEYAVKVLKDEASFKTLYNRLSEHIEKLPSANDLLKKHTGIDFTPGDD